MGASKDCRGAGSAGDDGSGLVSSLAPGGGDLSSSTAGQGGELGLVRLGAAELATAALSDRAGGVDRPMESTAWPGTVLAAGEPDHRRPAAVDQHDLALGGRRGVLFDGGEVQAGGAEWPLTPPKSSPCGAIT